jgi:signal transduction histidine kinase
MEDHLNKTRHGSAVRSERLRYDVIPAALCLLLALPALFVNPDRERFSPTEPEAWLALSLAVVGCAVLIARRRFPVPVLVVIVVLRAVMAAGVGDEFALLPPAAVALYTVARSEDRRRALVIALAAGAAMAVVVALAETDEVFVSELVGELAIALLPVAFADAVRSRGDRLRDLIDSEATARVQAERLRIARDLHDVVAHGLSVIAVQSGVAAHLIDDDPQQAKESLEVINAAGKQSLEELRVMVGVLRSTDDAPLMPTVTDPDDLSVIIDGARRGGLGDSVGLEVEVAVEGSFPADASDASVVAVHRILAEALANVARHGGGAPARVTLEHQGDRALLTVRNDAPSQRTVTSSAVSSVIPGSAPTMMPSTGVGIIGMTERAESLGGTLHAGPSADGAFTVTAVVPYHREDRAGS